MLHIVFVAGLYLRLRRSTVPLRRYRAEPVRSITTPVLDEQQPEVVPPESPPEAPPPVESRPRERSFERPAPEKIAQTERGGRAAPNLFPRAVVGRIARGDVSDRPPPGRTDRGRKKVDRNRNMRLPPSRDHRGRRDQSVTLHPSLRFQQETGDLRQDATNHGKTTSTRTVSKLPLSNDLSDSIPNC